jgi:Fe-S-cluster-containing hydrogenase component 2
MDKKLLIDLSKFRDCGNKSCDITPPEGFFSHLTTTNGLKSIRELAVFSFTCRRCEDAPCINVCPTEALEKNDDGMIERHINLCISCKSCVTICPFGTMMSDFFDHHRKKDLYFDLSNDHEIKEFIKACPNGAIELVDMDEDPEQDIYKLSDNVLVKEKIWSNDKS